jgi:hypothetical protein
MDHKIELIIKSITRLIQHADDAVIRKIELSNIKNICDLLLSDEEIINE